MRNLNITAAICAAMAVFCITTQAQAQSKHWTELMQDPNAQFSATVNAANAWFETHPTGKGSGWKQFKRWEYYMESRIAEDGSQSLPSRTLPEMEKYYQSHPELYNQKRNSSNGNWQVLGPVFMPANGTGQPNGIGRTTCLAFHPTDPQVLWVGSPSGGVWKSEDYGNTWIDLIGGLTRLGVSAIVVHPTQPDTIIIGTGDRDGSDAPGYGVWWSTNAGATWVPRNTGMGNREVHSILMHPSNPNILLASCQDRIYRSTDLGANWTLVYNVSEDFKELVFHPGDPNIVYAASNDFFRSSDNGVTWGQITSGVATGASRIAIAVTANNPNYVYLTLANNTAFMRELRSTDAGLNFTTRSTTPNIMGYDVTGGTGSQAWYDLVALGDPNNADHIFAAGINTWESFDGGTTWSIVTHWVGSGGNPPVHADHHVLGFSPHTGDLFIGNDGGLHRSSNMGVSFTEISSGMGIAQVYKIGQSQNTRDLVINGYQDNGTAIYRNGTWSTEIGGDGMECIIDPTTDQVMYGALYYGEIRRSDNNGLSFSTIVGSLTKNGAWVTPYKLHPTNANTMFAGFRELFRSTNCKSAATGAVTWTQISAFGGTSTIRDIAISPSNPDILYLSRSGTANFYRTNNANAASPTWIDLDAGMPGTGNPTDIEIDPDDPNHLWMTFGTNPYESVDGGVSWTDISGTMPAITMNTIVLDTASPVKALYVGTDAGVFYRDNTMANWISYSVGLPPVEITELEIYYDAECRDLDMLRAGTYGRGLYESDLRDPGNVPPDACFRGTPTETCVGMTVLLEDFSAYSPTSWAWTISPGTFSFVGGTNATTQNPQIQFNAIGFYTITLTATNGNGSDPYTRTSYINVSSNAASLPISENWETAALCGTAADCGTTVCPLVNGWVNETNGTDDNMDWRVDEGGTPSAGTGPSVDFNPGTATGNYVYTEASSCTGQTAHLVKPCVDLRTATSPELTFAYHMNGANMGELHLDIQANGVWNLDVMPVIVGDQGTAWLTRTVNLSAFVGNVVTIRFRGITGNGFASDMALDDINLIDNPPLPGNTLQLQGEYLAGNGNRLDWQYQGNDLPNNFLIERMGTSGQYAQIGETEWNTAQQFQWTDRQPLAGVNQYKVSGLDLAGNLIATGTVSILSDPSLAASLSIYPNPASHTLTIQLKTQENRENVLQIFDLAGRQVWTERMGEGVGEIIQTIDIQTIPAGVYLVRVAGFTQRLVVAK